VEVPEPATVVGVSVHVRPMLGEIATVRATLPANAFIAVTDIVEVPLTLARTVRLVGLAPIVKSWTV